MNWMLLQRKNSAKMSNAGGTMPSRIISTMNQRSLSMTAHPTDRLYADGQARSVQKCT